MRTCNESKTMGPVGLLFATGMMLLLPGCPPPTMPPPSDSCDGVVCADGESCVDGACVADTPGDPDGFKDADGIKGGAMYDKFWATETGFDQNDPNIDTLSNSSNFFRCKQCHAWDRLANTASYIDRAPKTDRPNVSGVQLADFGATDTPQEMFDAISTGHGATRRAVDADLSTFDPDAAAGTQVGDQMPDFSGILSDAQVWDLVKYFKEEALDTTQLYDVSTEGSYPDGSRTFSNVGKGGDAVNGNVLYGRCAGCHGDNGVGGSFPIADGAFSVGSFARSKPYELWHKVKFGQLGSPMAAQGINTLEDMQDLFAALADADAFPDPPPADPCDGACVAGESCVDGACVADTPDDPEGFKNADGIKGGAMYDKFWATETGFDQNDPNIDTLSNSSNFFRCKQCHAWDRLANTASYIDRAPKTDRPNVSGVQLADFGATETPQEMFDAISTGHGATRRAVDADLSTFDPAVAAGTQVGDQMPDFSGILSDAQVWDLVKYFKEEALDTTQLYDVATEGAYPDGSRTFSNVGKGGDAVNGNVLYGQCAGCHGDNGVGGSFPIADGAFSVGSFARSKPYELWHKVKFGQLGSPMAAQGINTLEDMQDLFAALADANAFPDPAAP